MSRLGTAPSLLGTAYTCYCGTHPINDKTSLQIIDVEPQEAEWCLEILEALFDYFYVAPAAAKKKKAALDAKLTAAGKPTSK